MNCLAVEDSYISIKIINWAKKSNQSKNNGKNIVGGRKLKDFMKVWAKLKYVLP